MSTIIFYVSAYSYLKTNFNKELGKPKTVGKLLCYVMPLRLLTQRQSLRIEI